MRSGGLRVLILVTSVVVLGVLFQDFRFDSWIAREVESSSRIDRDIQSVHVALADVRAAQAGYVATGQGPAFWMKRVTDLVGTIGATLERLRASTTNAEARAQYDAAAAALGDFQGIDSRARDDVNNEQRFLASDLIFMDSLETSRRVSAAAAAAGAAESAARQARVTRFARLRLATMVATLVWGMCVVWIVYARVRSLGAEVAAGAERERALVEAQQARESEPPPVRAPAPAAAPAPAESLVNLPDVAELCVDFGRVLDGRDVPALLDRTVKVLNAKGLVLWVVDTSGTFLRPWLLHGYPEKVVQRLGALQVDSDNMTSLAFRSLQAQTANSRTADASGAIAVPLVTSSGCVGVLAAELKRQRPDRDTLSAARMIAAQLAALASPAGGATGKAAQA